MAQHLSIRVPWHDNEWNGTVCISPSCNNSCLKLKNIYENINDEKEESICGKCMSGQEINLPCINEGAALMSNKWLNMKLAEVWIDRGAFSGLGAMLCVLNIELGVLIAKEIKKSIDETKQNLWEYMDLVIEEDVKLSKYFTDSEKERDENIISEILLGNQNNITFEKWENKEELEQKILKVLVENTDMENEEDLKGFNTS